MKRILFYKFYKRYFVYYIFKFIVKIVLIEMALKNKDIEKEYFMHLKICEYHNPNLCSKCFEIYEYFKNKYNIKTFSDIFKKINIKQKYNRLLCEDRNYFINAFEPLLKRELEKYTFNSYIEKSDLQQEGYIILMKLFETSKYRMKNPAKFVSYIKKTFPKMLLQKYLFFKKKNNIGEEYKEENLIHLNKSYNNSEVLDDILLVAEDILTETSYLIFELYYKYKYTIMDISLLLNVCRNYVINSLYYSRQKLKKYFNKKNNR